ncbi:Replication factor C (RF-C) subunit [Chytriomyces hyalinus]|nr:Replication factor C (RF-C) subunit [Chytriomyces hyalinus]
MNARGYSTAPSGATELISHKDVFSSYRIFFLLFSRMPLHLHVVALQFPNFIDESKLPHLLFYGPPVEPPTSVVEKYTQNLRFCIICNVSKIIPALQSRCTRFHFAPIKEEFIHTRLDHVVEAEKYLLFISPFRKPIHGNFIVPSVEITRLKLSKGDMRRMLNILQAVHAAYPQADEAAIYTCVGSPMPSDVTKITDLLFGETFDVVYSRCNPDIQALKIDKGLVLSVIIGELHSTLSQMELPPKVRSALLIKLADVEYNLTVGCSKKIQLASLIGGFKVAVDLVSSA